MDRTSCTEMVCAPEVTLRAPLPPAIGELINNPAEQPSARGHVDRVPVHSRPSNITTTSSGAAFVMIDVGENIASIDALLAPFVAVGDDGLSTVLHAVMIGGDITATRANLSQRFTTNGV